MDEQVPKLNLAQKIKAIQDSVGVVKKKGTHTQGWKYLQIEDAVSAVNKLMAARGLIMTGTLARKPDGSFDIIRASHHSGKDGEAKGYIVDLVMEWTVEDIETAEKRSYCMPGCGFDSTDKGVYKAETGSRKYAIINIFNLPVGDNPEATVSREDAKAAQENVVSRKLTEAAKSDNPKVREIATDAMSQVEPERKVVISRPIEHNGNYIGVSGLLAVPQLEQFFLDTNSKRFQTKTKPIMVYWRVPSEYEKGLVTLCQKLGIEVEG